MKYLGLHVKFLFLFAHLKCLFKKEKQVTLSMIKHCINFYVESDNYTDS